MYLDFYQLREYPFTLTSDLRFLYFSAGHKEAMSGLLYSLRERKGVALLLGEPGMGKTTVLAAVLEMMAGKVSAQYLDSPLHATPREALAAILSGFGVTAEDGGLSGLLASLRQHLSACHDRGECALLVIDEAQDLAPVVLEQVRLLTNLESGGHKLLQIILSGQPELAAHLRTPQGRALQQRIGVRCQLGGLSAPETQAYLGARLEHAGAPRPIFDLPAMQRVHHLARGVPRVINVIADHCLLAGFAAQAPRVGRALVDRVAVQLEMTAPAGTEAEAGPTPAAAAPAAAAGRLRPPALLRFASGCARWAGLTEGAE